MSSIKELGASLPSVIFDLNLCSHISQELFSPCRSIKHVEDRSAETRRLLETLWLDHASDVLSRSVVEIPQVAILVQTIVNGFVLSLRVPDCSDVVANRARDHLFLGEVFKDI